MAIKRKYTDEQFVFTVKNSYSISQVLEKLGLSPTGSNYKCFKLRAKTLNIDYSHFTGQSYLKGRTHNWNNKIPLIEILVKNSEYLWNASIKRRLLKEGILEYKCYECGINKWREEKISLQLEHRNGDNTDNRIENLILLCPNCHSQTKTFAGRNIKIEKKRYFCQKCNKKISQGSKSGLCVKCVKNTITDKIRKVKDRPSKEQLLKEIEEIGYCSVGRKYGVSDNTIRKWVY
jgi:Zn finger protein HypA/HybF involved in hydrogenase expression